MNSKSLLNHLSSQVESGRLSHAYIIEGNLEGAEIIAVEFAKTVTPYHEDIIKVKADGLSIKNEAVETIQGRLALKPLVGNHTVIIIQDADSMTARAQNRLLKTLEEPSGDSVMILLSQNTENLLQTIRSRCNIYRLDGDMIVNDKIDRAAVELAEHIAAMLLEQKGFYCMYRILNEAAADRVKAYAFLDALELWFRNKVMDNVNTSTEEECYEKAFIAVSAIEEARRNMNSNVNTGYAIKNMILKSI